MRYIKFVPNPSFQDDIEFERYFQIELPQRDPPGRISFVGSKLGSNSLRVGETLLFSFEGTLRYVAEVAVGVQQTFDDENRWFAIDLDSLHRTRRVSWQELESLFKLVIPDLPSFHTQAWQIIPDSTETYAIVKSLLEPEAGEDWTKQEIRLLLSDYFDMLLLESKSEPFNKSHHNAQLREILTSRNKGAVERKHQNVSAVLDAFGLPWINGYKPAKNAQGLLKECILEFIQENSLLINAIQEARSNRHNNSEKEEPAEANKKQREYVAVDPIRPYSLVFLFPIGKLSDERDSHYDSTRHWWNVPKNLREVQNSLALGIIAGNSVAAFEIDSWRASNGKYEFDGCEVSSTNELAYRNLKLILENCRGYWTRGRPVAVQFDGKGSYRFLQGKADKSWFSLRRHSVDVDDEDLELLYIAAGKIPKPGYQRNVQRKIATELRAMEMAIAHFRNSWDVVEDVSKGAPYDLHCLRESGEELRVEVKGTTGGGESVILTRGEVENAKQFKTALFVLKQIKLVETVDGIAAEGGVSIVYEPWAPDERQLEALTYKYSVK